MHEKLHRCPELCCAVLCCGVAALGQGQAVGCEGGRGERENNMSISNTGAHKQEMQCLCHHATLYLFARSFLQKSKCPTKSPSGNALPAAGLYGAIWCSVW